MRSPLPACPSARAERQISFDAPDPEGLMDAMRSTLFDLEKTIRQRRSADPSQSYVAKLSARGRAKIAQKVGEEAVEAVIAAMASDRDGLVGESADLLFHLLVLLGDLDIPLDAVLDELDRREGVSGIAEKAARPSD